MSLRFCVLGSGSTGNASYVETDDFGLLLDIGLGPRRIAKGLAEAGARWENVRAVVLTHGHSDHWDDNSFRSLVRYQIPFYCHAQHGHSLEARGGHFAELMAAGLVRTYVQDQPLQLGPLRTTPFEVPHDHEPTCGFRMEASGGTLAYAADLGCWTEAIVHQLRDADILAVEFNHDVALQRNSGRAPMLIDRVLGERGHLSNEQGADLVAETLRRSEPGRLRHLVLLHLSQQCNHPRLARSAAEGALAKHGRGISIHVARPSGPTAVLTGHSKRAAIVRDAVGLMRQPLLPGWDHGEPETKATIIP